MKKRINAILIILIMAVLLSVSVTATDLQLQNEKNNPQTNIEENSLNKIELHFLDVGQGDSTLVILPDGKTMLIDAGKNEYGSTVVNYMKDLNISKIDCLVMTHPDADHIGGMSKVIDNFEIGNIYMTDKTSTTKTFEDLLLKMENKKLTFATLQANDIISESDDFVVELLAPINKVDDSNEMSLVIKIIYKNNSFILMGDAGTKVENDIIYSNANITADLIKIGHHGSSSSSSDRFIEKVSPQFAIISLGQYNQYGHPNSKTINTLNKYGVEIFRTDELGNIIVISDGNIIDINNKSINLFNFL